MNYVEDINKEENQGDKVSESMYTGYQVSRPKRRLAHSRKIQPSNSWNQGEQEELKPYTMEELNARLDRAEADVIEGRVMSRAEASRRMKEHIAQYVQI